MSDYKLKPRLANVSKRPIMIVGQNPGNHRDGFSTEFVWESGNRSSDYLLSLIGTRDNLIFTNICNYKVITGSRLNEGLRDLRKLVIRYKPKKIICLGQVSYVNMKKLNLEVPIVKLLHPSFVLRFNKDKLAYKQQLIGELE